LAVALAPSDLAARDLRQVLALLFLAPELEQRGPEHPDAEAAQRQPAAHLALLFVEDLRARRIEPRAAQLAWPRRRRVALRDHRIEPALRVGVREALRLLFSAAPDLVFFPLR